MVGAFDKMFDCLCAGKKKDLQDWPNACRSRVVLLGGRSVTLSGNIKSSSGLSFHVPSKPEVLFLKTCGPRKSTDITFFVAVSFIEAPWLNTTKTPFSVTFWTTTNSPVKIEKQHNWMPYYTDTLYNTWECVVSVRKTTKWKKKCVMDIWLKTHTSAPPHTHTSRHPYTHQHLHPTLLICRLLWFVSSFTKTNKTKQLLYKELIALSMLSVWIEVDRYQKAL